MGAMASWKDGAAYAPIERPDGFATPLADPLPTGAPYAADTPGAIVHPDRFDADPAQAELAALGTAALTRRDPRDRFEVASMTMTAGPGKRTGRDPHEAFAAGTPAVTTPGPPPPTGSPLSVGPPNQGWPVPPGAQPHPGRQTHPAPPPAAGAPRQQWAPPQPGGQAVPQQWGGQPPSPAGRDQTRTLCWIGAVLCGVGVMFTAAAPFLLLVAGGLGLRTTARTSYLGPTALVIGGLMLLFQLFDGSLGSSGILMYLASLGACIWFVKGALGRT